MHSRLLTPGSLAMEMRWTLWRPLSEVRAEELIWAGVDCYRAASFLRLGPTWKVSSSQWSLNHSTTIRAVLSPHQSSQRTAVSPSFPRDHSMLSRSNDKISCFFSAWNEMVIQSTRMTHILKRSCFFFNSSTFQGRLRNSISQNPSLCQVMATYPKQSGILQVFLAIDWPKKTIHCPICLRWWIPGKHVIPKASEPHYPSLSVWSECGSSRPISVPALGIRQTTGKKWWHWKLWFIVRENKYDKKSHWVVAFLTAKIDHQTKQTTEIDCEYIVCVNNNLLPS